MYTIIISFGTKIRTASSARAEDTKLHDFDEPHFSECDYRVPNRIILRRSYPIYLLMYTVPNRRAPVRMLFADLPIMFYLYMGRYIYYYFTFTMYPQRLKTHIYMYICLLSMITQYSPQQLWCMCSVWIYMDKINRKIDNGSYLQR